MCGLTGPQSSNNTLRINLQLPYYPQQSNRLRVNFKLYFLKERKVID